MLFTVKKYPSTSDVVCVETNVDVGNSGNKVSHIFLNFLRYLFILCYMSTFLFYSWNFGGASLLAQATNMTSQCFN